MIDPEIVPLSAESRAVYHVGGCVVVATGGPSGSAVVLDATEWRELARTLNRWAALASRKAALEAIKRELGPEGPPPPEPPVPNGPACG